MLSRAQEFKSPLGHQLMHTDRKLLIGSSRQDPLVLELEYLGSHLEVDVVVHDRHPVLSREYRRQQIDDAHRSMSPSASQEALRIECPLPVAIVGGQVLVRLTTVGPHLLVLRRAPRAVERLGIQAGAGSHQTPGDEGLQPVRDGSQPHPGRRAGVDKEPGDHRHTSARWRDPPSPRAPPPEARSPAGRARPRSPPAARRRGPCPTPRWCSARVGPAPAARHPGRSGASSSGVLSMNIYREGAAYIDVFMPHNPVGVADRHARIGVRM